MYTGESATACANAIASAGCALLEEICIPPPTENGTTCLPSSRGNRKTPGSNLAFLIASYCRNQLPMKYMAALPSPKALFASAKATPRSPLSNAPLSTSHLYLLNAASISASVNLTVPALRFCAQSGVLPRTSADIMPSSVNAAAHPPSPAPAI